MFRRVRLAAGVCATLAVVCFSPAMGQPLPATGHAEEPVRLLDVPYVPQSARLCGGAALAMVYRFWGERELLAEDFTTLIVPGEPGIRTDAMLRAVQSRGGAPMLIGRRSEVQEQLSKGRPVIALIGVGGGLYHYVVLVAWVKGGVILHDPAVAPFRIREEKAFEEDWSRGGRWALVVLPGPTGAVAARPDTTLGTDPVPAPVAALPTGCDAMVEAAIVQARNGATTEAEMGLRTALALCPTSAAPLRGLAGLRFKADDWAGAARLAERALVFDPNDGYTWRLLAGSRFLLGDEEGALRAWNRVSEPRADLTRIDGLSRTRYRAVSGQLGLESGRLLTSKGYLRARRRLAELPAQSQSRLSLKPLPQGNAQVNVAMVERPLLFDGALDAGAAGIRAFAEREVTLRLASPTGNGELWTAGYRWQGERPRVSLGLSVPAPGGHPGLWRVEGFWERQTYAGEPTLGSQARALVTREERRRSSLSFADWIAPSVRLEVGAALDKWSARGAYLSAQGKLEAPLVGDRLLLRAEAAQWTSLDGAAPFAAGAVLARWNPESARRGGWLARVGVTQASSRAPLSLWTGAGTGRGREPLLRAHPLLEDGVVAGRTFGRTLLHTGLERQRWLGAVQSLRIGAGVFVDGAKAWHTLQAAREPWQFDVGAGFRFAGLGGRGVLRIDAAHGLQDGESALSVGWDVR